MISGSEVKSSVDNGSLVFVEISVVGMLLLFACTLRGTAQIYCSGGILPGSSLGFLITKQKL